jgi:hypothetical protein
MSSKVNTKLLGTPEELSHNEQLQDVSPASNCKMSPLPEFLCVFKLSEVVKDYFNEET